MRKVLLLLVLVLAACAPSPPGETIPSDTPAYVRVDNMRPLDMTIWVVGRDGYRERLGIVRAASIATLKVPLVFTRSSATVRFIADPIGGRSLPVSHDINIGPGDEVLMRIEP